MSVCSDRSSERIENADLSRAFRMYRVKHVPPSCVIEHSPWNPLLDVRGTTLFSSPLVFCD